MQLFADFSYMNTFKPRIINDGTSCKVEACSDQKTGFAPANINEVFSYFVFCINHYGT